MIQPAPIDPPELDRALWSSFTPGALGFDVGANCGQTLGRIGSLCTDVVAFEPAEEAFEYLVTHFGGRGSITLIPLAVSDSTGTVDLMAAPSKIATGQLVTHGTAGMEWSEDEMANGVIRSLESTTLDDFCASIGRYPDFLKIDVEGHEGHVLAGATEVLKRRPQMLIEVHSQVLGDLIAELLQSAYDVRTIRHPHYQPNTTLWRTHFWYVCIPRKTEES